MTTETPTIPAAAGTRARASAQSADSDLGLDTVLTGSLPATLLTDAAPERYTVEAVFTRKPDREEVAAILGSGTREFLARAGYPTIEIAVSDRRLEIVGTNLEELRDGLGAALARRLADVSAAVRERRLADASRARDASDREHDRSAMIAALAASVSFAPRVGGRTDDDAAQAEHWVDEGGSLSA